MKVVQYILRMAERYNKYTEQNPAKSIVLTTGFIFGAGDILTQRVEYYFDKEENKDAQKKEFVLNKMRLAHILLYGATILGPFSYYWYTHALPRIAPITIHTNKSQIFKKIFIDQSLGSVIQYSSFLVAMTILGGKSVKEETQKLKSDFISCFKGDLCLWPWVQFMNFKFVPIHLQPLVVNIVSVFWNSYVSKIHHSKYELPKEEKEASLMFNKTAMLAI